MPLFLLLCLLLIGLVAGPRPMPTHHPRVAHFMPYLVGDSLGAIKRAKRLGFRFIDQNALCTKDGWAVVMHWPRVKRAYRWMHNGQFKGRGRRRREVRVRIPPSWPTTVDAMTAGQVKALRSARVGGTRPRLVEEHMREAARLGLTLCLEVKGSPGFRQSEVWERMARAAERTGVTIVIMTLTNLPNQDAALARLQQAHDAGFPALAVLPRTRRPANWVTDWVPLGVQVWGRWR